MNQLRRLHAQLDRQSFQRRFQTRRVPRRQARIPIREFRQLYRIDGRLRGGGGVDWKIFREKVRGSFRQLLQQRDFAFEQIQHSSPVCLVLALNSGHAPVKPFGREHIDVLPVHPLQFRHVELGVVPENLRQVELLDDFLNRQNLPVVLRRPTQQAQIVTHRFRQVAVFDVASQRGEPGFGRVGIALAHLRAVDVQNHREVRVGRRLDAERAEQRDVLRRVREMIFATDDMRDLRLDAERAKEGDVFRGVREMVLAANDVRDLHFQIVNDIDEVENRVAVAADDDEIGIGDFPVAERARDGAGNQIVHRDWIARHLETDCAFAFVGQAGIDELPGALPVNLGALGLEVRTLVVVEAKPFQAVENRVEGLLSVARRVGVFDA